MKKKLVSKENQYEENLRITKNELRDIFKKMDLKLLNDKFMIDGKNIIIPNDKELRLKVKFEVDKNYAVNFRISWRNEDFIESEINNENVL